MEEVKSKKRVTWSSFWGGRFWFSLYVSQLDKKKFKRSRAWIFKNAV